MITATAQLLGTITATAQIFSTQVGSCAAATAVIKDSAGTTLQTESIPSGATEDITISDSSVNVNKSNGLLISDVTVLAENTASYNVADSVVVLKDTAGTTLLTENIRATESENITAPDGTINLVNTDGDPVSTQTVRSNQTKSVTLANVAWTDSDGSAESTPYTDAIVCTPQVKSLFSKFTWESGDDTTSTITVDADSAGTYTSISDDGASGTITLDINSGGYGAFSNPTALGIGDTVALKRTVTTALGWAKITGTYV